MTRYSACVAVCAAGVFGTTAMAQISGGDYVVFGNGQPPAANDSISNTAVVGGTSTYTHGTGTPPNTLNITGLNFVNVAPETEFRIADLMYLNAVTGGTSATSVDCNVNMVFTAPAPALATFGFTLGFLVTPNNSNPLSNPANDDFLYFPNSFASVPVNIGGTDYFLEILGFRVTANSPLLAQFRLPEETTSTGGLYARFTTVPTPGAAALAAIGGLVMSRRRR